MLYRGRMSLRRVLTLLLASLVLLYLLFNAGDPVLPVCTTTLANLTHDNYFVFIAPKYADAAVFSNMFYYIGLKHSQYFAVNVEQPMTWYGLSNMDGSFLQDTRAPPRIMCQEQSYDPESINNILPEYTASDKVVLGFLRDPLQVFLSCLLQKVQYMRRANKNSVSLMVDKNVNDFLDQFEGNTRRTSSDIHQTSCNNQLAFALGLDEWTYKANLNNDDAPEKFADKVLSHVTDFLIYERLEESIYHFLRKYCLTPTQDYMFFRQIPETYVGIGFGSITTRTKNRLKDFLRYDYALYETVTWNFNKDLNNAPLGWGFTAYKSELRNFFSTCCDDTLSLDPSESKGRKFGLTAFGKEDIQCRVIHSSSMIMSNMLHQIQESYLTDNISQAINTKQPYSHFVRLIADSLNQEVANLARPL